jgi:hypothetical protein
MIAERIRDRIRKAGYWDTEVHQVLVAQANALADCNGDCDPEQGMMLARTKQKSAQERIGQQ